MEFIVNYLEQPNEASFAVAETKTQTMFAIVRRLLATAHKLVPGLVTEGELDKNFGLNPNIRPDPGLSAEYLLETLEG